MYFAQQNQAQNLKQQDKQEDLTLFCYCKGSNSTSDIYIGCEADEQCPYGGWFHPECVPELQQLSQEELDNFINSAPWYCNDCKIRIEEENLKLLEEEKNEPIRISLEPSEQSSMLPSKTNSLSRRSRKKSSPKQEQISIKKREQKKYETEMKKPTPPPIEQGNFGFLHSQLSQENMKVESPNSNLIQLHLQPLPEEKRVTRRSKRNYQ